MKKILVFLLLTPLFTLQGKAQCGLQGDLDVQVTTTAPSSCGLSDGSAIIDLSCDSDSGNCFDVTSVAPDYTCDPADYAVAYTGNGDYYVNNGETVLIYGPFNGTVVVNAGGTLVTCGEVTLNNQVNLVEGAKMVNIGDLTLHAYNLNAADASLQNYGSITLMYQSSSSWGSIEVDEGLVQNYGTISLPIDYSLNTAGSFFENYGELIVGTEPGLQELKQTNVRGRMINRGSITTALNTQIDPGGILINYCQLHSSKNMYLTNTAQVENYGAITIVGEFYLRNSVTIGGGSSIIAGKLVLENLDIVNNDASCALLKGTNELRIQIYQPYTEVSANGPMSICTEGNSYELQWLNLQNGANLDCSCQPIDPSIGSNGTVATNCTVTWPDGTVSNERFDLASGSYDITITCSNVVVGTETIVIEESTVGIPALDLTSTNTSAGSCDGQISLLNVSEGTAPYTFFLNGTQRNFPFTGLCPGEYTISVQDSKGCGYDTLVTIIDEGNVNCSGFDVSINELTAPSSGNCNGAYEAVVVGAIGAVSYTWQDVNGLVIGNSTTQTGLCIEQLYAVEVTDASTNCMATTTVYTGDDLTPNCGHDITINSRNLSCAQANDGVISLSANIEFGGGAPGDCYTGSGPQITCDVCDAFLSGNLNGEALNDGRQYCIVAGTSVSGNLNIQNATVVACGDVSKLSVTLGNNGTLVLNGNSQLQSISGYGTNAKLINTGNLSISQLNSEITFLDNYGTITCDYYYKFNSALGVHNNYGNIHVNQSANIQGVFNNYGTINATNWDQNSNTGQTTNYCTLTISGNLYLNSLLKNEGTLHSTGTWHLNNQGLYQGVNGSLTNGNHLHMYGTMQGIGSASILKFTGSVNAHGTMSGALQVCGFPNPGAVNAGPEVVFYNDCDDIAETCHLSWFDAQNNLISTDTIISGLAAGTYHYELTCGSCVETGEVTISAPAPLALTLSETSPSSCTDRCDGELQASVSGGTSPYYFEWDDGSTFSYLYPACPGTHHVLIRDSKGCETSDQITLNASSGDCCTDFTLTMSAENATSANSYNGSATAVPNGGIADYMYKWSREPELNNKPFENTQTITGLLPGNYNVTVLDAQFCRADSNVTIAYASDSACSLNANLIVDNLATCIYKADGELHVETQNATQPVSYTWYHNNSLLNVNQVSYNAAANGHYEVLVSDAEGCEVWVTNDLNYLSDRCDTCQLFSMAVDGSVDASCIHDASGALSWSVNNGNSPFEYRWYGNTTGSIDNFALPNYTISNLLPGDYLVTARDEYGCRATVREVLDGYNVPCSECAAFTASIEVDSSSSSIVCDAAAYLTITDDGNTAYSYEILWSNGSAGTDSITSQCAGDYWVRVIQYFNGDSICQQMLEFNLPEGPTIIDSICTDNDPLELSIDVTTEVTGAPFVSVSWLDLEVSGGIGNYSYYWNNGAVTQDISVQTEGIYKVIVMSGECSDTATVTITDTATCPDPNGCDDRVEWFVTQPNCPDTELGNINLVVHHFGSGAPYTFLWDNIMAVTEDISYQEPGNYFVNVSDKDGNTAKYGPIMILSGGSCPSDTCSAYAIVVDSLCSDISSNGSIDLIQFGSPTFTYNWYKDGVSGFANTQDLTNLSAGVYYAEVSDGNGCVAETTPVEMITGNNSSCPDDSSVCGTFSVSIALDSSSSSIECDAAAFLTIVDDNNPNYTYEILWSNGSAGVDSISGQCAGDYWVRIIQYFEGDSVCQQTLLFDLPDGPTVVDSICTDNDPLNLTIDVSTESIGAPFVPLNKLDLQVRGGIGNYAYYWSNGAVTQDISVQTEGTYTVIVTSGECSDTASVTVVDTTTACPDPNGCKDRIEWFVSQPECPEKTLGHINLVVHHFGSGGPYSFLWDDILAVTEDVSFQTPGDYYVTVMDIDGNRQKYGPITIDEISDTCVSTTCGGFAVVTDSICSDEATNGTINLVTQQGTAPFSYNWFKDGVADYASTQNLINAGTGSYYAMVSDALGCTFQTTPVQISVGSAPCDSSCQLIVSSSPTLTCPGAVQTGIVFAHAVGGIAPQYTWDIPASGPVVSGLGTGTYTVTVSDAGNPHCQQSATVVVDAMLEGECPDCNFDPEILSIGDVGCGLDGTLLYVSMEAASYSWSTGESTRSINVDAPGTYTVTVRKSDLCDTITLSIEVSDDDDLTGGNKIYADDEFLCNGSSLTLHAPYVPGATYEWFPNGETTQTIDVTEPGRYWVLLTINECLVKSSDYVVTKSPAPEDIFITAVIDSLCTNSKVSYPLMSPFGIGNAWYFENELISTDQIVQINNPGDYTLQVTYPGCLTLEAVITIKENSKCDTTDINCTPLANILSGFDPDDLADCKEVLIQQATYNAQAKYDDYLEGLRIDFENNYINHCLDAVETFTVENTGGEATHHYTLYYYDQAGNLVRTIPPEGVQTLDPAVLSEVSAEREAGLRTTIPNHQYATTYTYNSLNQLYAEAVPDRDFIIYHAVIPSTGVDDQVTVNGTHLSDNGTAVLFGSDSSGNAVLYYSEDDGASWQSVAGIGTENLNAAYIADDNTFYAAGEAGTVLRSDNNGIDWGLRYIGVPKEIEYLTFFASSPEEGMVITDDLFVYTTNNKGDNWTSDGTIDFDDIVGAVIDYEFISRDLGYLISNIGNKGRLYQTNDGGISWQELYINSIQASILAAASTSDAIILVGENGLLLEQDTDESVFIPTGLNELDLSTVIPLNGNYLLRNLSNDTWFNLNTQTGEPESIGQFEELYITQEANDVMTLNNQTLNSYSDTGFVETILDVAPEGMSFVSVDNYIYWQNDELYLKIDTSDQFLALELSGNTSWTAINGGHVTENPNPGANNVSLITEDTWYFGEDVGNSLDDSSALWQIVTPIDWDLSFEELEFVSALDGFVRTETQCYITRDGGRNWTLYATMDNNDPDFVDVAFSASGIIGIDDQGDAFVWNSLNGWQALDIDARAFNYSDLEVLRGSTASDYQLYTSGNDGQVLWINFEGLDVTVEHQASSVSSDLSHVKTGENSATPEPYAFAGSSVWTSFDGSDWVTGTADSSFALSDIALNTAEDVVALDEYGDLFVKAAGNTSWSDVLASGFNSVDNFSTATTTYSLAVGTDGQLLVRTGSQNELRNAFNVPAIEDATILESGVGYAVGALGSILKTVDGGQSWIAQSAPTSAQLNAVAFYDNNNGFVVGDGGLLYTNDGGINWIQSAITEQLNAIAYRTANEAIVAGNATGTTPRLFTLSIPSLALNAVTAAQFGGTLPPAEDLNAIHFVNEQVGHVVGANNSIYRYNNRSGGGSPWLYLPTVSDVNDGDYETVYFFDEENGYFGGSADGIGVLLKVGLLNNSTWSSINLADSPALSDPVVDIDFSDPTKALALTADGAFTIEERSDRFTSLFWYDELGREVLSQNSRQSEKLPPAYTYTFYDHLGRITEKGEVTQGNDPTAFLEKINTSFNVLESDVRDFVSTGERREVVRNYYDMENSYLAQIETHYASSSNPLVFDNTTLRNRTSSQVYIESPGITTGYELNLLTTGVFDYAYHYNYDIHGHVKTMIMDNPALDDYNQRYKRIDYDFDLISGNINTMVYQSGELDQFHHRYSYDADNRLALVETSTNGYVWQKEVDYDYYRHGPLMREEIGDLSVQGNDYVYTLQGWTKAMNSNNLVASLDVGQDGSANDLPSDEFGYELGYYQGDYLAIGSHHTGSQLGGAITTDNHSEDLYNGNVSRRVTAIAHFMSSSNAPGVTGYQYDQLNRLTSTQWYDGNGTDLSNVSNAGNQYKVEIDYDANGNIKNLNRYEGGGASIDELTFNYDTIGTRHNNHLLQVSDNAAATGGSDIQAGQSTSNYDYDETGNLSQDLQEEIDSIAWTHDHKMSRVFRTAGSTLPNLEFGYDGSRRRIMKREVTSTDTTTTWYFRDANGKVMAVYNESGSTLSLRERNVYGQDMLGLNKEVLDLSGGSNTTKLDSIVKVDYGTNHYALKDHLGNVNVVINGKRMPNNPGGTSDAFEAEVIAASDYYPYGMQMPGRRYNSSDYSYGFNGNKKDNALKGDGNSYNTTAFGTYDPRTGRLLHSNSSWSTYPGMNPYSYSFNNPIIHSDAYTKNPLAAVMRLGKQSASFVELMTANGITQSNYKELIRLGEHLKVNKETQVITVRLDQSQDAISSLIDGLNLSSDINDITKFEIEVASGAITPDQFARKMLALKSEGFLRKLRIAAELDDIEDRHLLELLDPLPIESEEELMKVTRNIINQTQVSGLDHAAFELLRNRGSNLRNEFLSQQ